MDKAFVKHALRCLVSLLTCGAWLGLLFFCYSAKVTFTPGLRIKIKSGANPTIASYNASAVKIYNATS
jgi:hypothetical protein